KGGFEPIAGATQSTYTVSSDDVGHALYVQVKAKNADGVAWADSRPSSSVKAVPAGSGMQVSSISLPNRLVLAGSGFTPVPSEVGRGTVQARFRVMDTEGHPVQGALVYALGLPYGWAENVPEVATGTDGWASVMITPTTRVPSAAKHIV